MYFRSIWKNIKSRCQDPKCLAYPRYGARGITIRPAWSDDFELFHREVIDEIGDRPEGFMTLDRIDNDGHYEPGNIRWATVSEQNANRNPYMYQKRKGREHLPRWVEERKSRVPGRPPKFRAAFVSKRIPYRGIFTTCVVEAYQDALEMRKTLGIPVE